MRSQPAQAETCAGRVCPLVTLLTLWGRLVLASSGLKQGTVDLGHAAQVLDCSYSLTLKAAHRCEGQECFPGPKNTSSPGPRAQEPEPLAQLAALK